jgi:hypothetical protein
MKTLALIFTVIAGVASVAICPAGQTAELTGGVPLIQVDWQVPQSLPPRFRNHCAFDPFSGRPYCSDHCGSDYQFYYCSRQSFGCCRVGFGYCDWSGLLRCHL